MFKMEKNYKMVLAFTKKKKKKIMLWSDPY